MTLSMQFFHYIDNLRTPFSRYGSMFVMGCALSLSLAFVATGHAEGGGKKSSEESVHQASQAPEPEPAKDDQPPSYEQAKDDQPPPYEPAYRGGGLQSVDGRNEWVVEREVVPITEMNTSPREQFVDIVYSLNPADYAVGEYVKTPYTFTRYDVDGRKWNEYQSEFLLFPRGIHHKPGQIIGMLYNTATTSTNPTGKSCPLPNTDKVHVLKSKNMHSMASCHYISLLNPTNHNHVSNCGGPDHISFSFGRSETWNSFQDKFGRTTFRVATPVMHKISRAATESGDVFHFDMHLSSIELLDEQMRRRRKIAESIGVIPTPMMEIQSHLLKVVFMNPAGYLTCSINVPEGFEVARSLVGGYGIKSDTSSFTELDAFKKTLKDRIHQDLMQLLVSHELSVYWIKPDGGEQQVYNSDKSRGASTYADTYRQGSSRVKLASILSAQNKHKNNTVRFEIRVVKKSHKAKHWRDRKVSEQSELTHDQLPLLVHLFQQQLGVSVSTAAGSAKAVDKLPHPVESKMNLLASPVITGNNRKKS